MSKTYESFTRALIVLLVVAIGVPELLPAQQPAQQQPPAQQQQPQQQQQQPGVTIDPSQGPLNPVPTTEPAEQPAPATQPQAAPAQAPPQSTVAPQQQPREPMGAAAAEGIRTQGGGASRPAGSAIAPAKQHQVRSFLIKLGAVAAAGIAIGTVLALSKGTPSTPPNAGATTTGTR